MPGLVTKLATAGLLAMAIEKACGWGHGIRDLSPFQPAEHACLLMPMHSMGHAPRSPRALHATSRAWAAALASAGTAACPTRGLASAGQDPHAQHSAKIEGRLAAPPLRDLPSSPRRPGQARPSSLQPSRWQTRTAPQYRRARWAACQAAQPSRAAERRSLPLRAHAPASRTWGTKRCTARVSS